MNRVCENCGRVVPPKEQMYSIKIDMFARADPLVIDGDDLQEDNMAKIEEIIEQLESVDPDEAMAEVFESYSFDLCTPCRRLLHQQLMAKARQTGQT